MRTLALLLFTALAVASQTYRIATVAGGVPVGLTTGTGDGGQALAAGLGNSVADVAADAYGNIYIAAGNLVREVSAAGVITTVAGGGVSVADFVPAVQAALSPSALASTASGVLYIADNAFGVSRIRRVDSSGIITTVAGGSCCTLGDGGPATAAYLGDVLGIALDNSGNLYIAQNLLGAGLIRKVNLTGTITTIAGGGACCALNEGGSATAVSLFSPTGVAVDNAGNVYIAEYGGNRVRVVSGGLIHTVAGNGNAADSGDGGSAVQAGIAHPWHISIDSGVPGGAILISEMSGARVRLLAANGNISTAAGNGSEGFSGDGGPAVSAMLGQPSGIGSAGNGVFYLADTSGQIGRVRALTPSLIRPVVSPGGVVPVFSSTSVIQPGSWVSIYGSNLASATTVWGGDFPTTLGNTSVTVNGKAAYLWFVSPGQINFQAPDDTATGLVPVTVTTPAGSFSAQVTLRTYAPSFSLLNNKYPAAIVLTPGSPGNSGNGYDIIGPAGAFSFPTRPAHAGETLVLFGVGFGPTNPSVAAGKIFSGAAPGLSFPQVSIGGASASVAFSGIVQAGLFQLNVQVPKVPGGDQPLAATIGGATTPSSVLITIQ